MYIIDLTAYPTAHELSVKICWGEHDEESAKVWFNFREGNLAEVYPEENLSIPAEVMVDAKRQVMYDLTCAFFDAEESRRKRVATFKAQENEENGDEPDQCDGQVVGAACPSPQL